MYEVRNAGVKGFGVFAKVPIPRGTRIFSERPTLSIRHDQSSGDVYTASRLLSPASRLRILQLSSHIASPLFRWAQVLGYTVKQLVSDLSRRKGKAFVPGMRELREHRDILSIFRTNAFSLGPSSTIYQAVFASVARLNHSCIPNAQGNFHEGLGRFNVHATRDILFDEELTINYLPEHGATKLVRQRSLSEGYGFECECPACDLSSSMGSESERRRLGMQEELGAFAKEAAESGRSAELELETIRSYIRLYEDEGIAGRELSTMYFEAAKLNEELCRAGDALECAELGLRIDRDCLGDDHELFEQGVETVRKLEAHRQDEKLRQNM